MIELVVKIMAPRGKGLAPMIQSMGNVQLRARLERACVDCRLYAETGNPQSLLYVEQWETRGDLEAQLRSPRFGTLIAIIETAPEAPELQVRTISEQRGLEYVRSVRLPPELSTLAENGYPKGISVDSKSD